jgi:PAS domain S-box-containing protein
MPDAPSLLRGIIGLLTVVLLALAVGGTWVYRSARRSATHQAIENLSSIARLKTDHVATWRRDRLADGRQFSESPFLADGIVRYLAAPRGDAEAAVRAQLLAMQRERNYSDALLVDTTGLVRLSVRGSVRSFNVRVGALAVAMRERSTAITDLHADENFRTVHITVVTPIFARADSYSPPIALIVLVDDAAQSLFPLIQSWPTPSPTAEALLIRRDGDHAVYLNDPRQQPASAKRLAYPLSRTDIPAVNAVLGHTGLFEGTDYRGVEVVSILLPVPDSPWFMEAKVDAAEIFAEWHRRAVMILAVLGALLTSVFALGLTAWQRDTKRHYRALYESEAALRASEEGFRRLFESSADAILLLDDDRIIDCNDTAVKMFRASNKTELQAATTLNVSPPVQPNGRDSKSEHDRHRMKTDETGCTFFEWTHLRLGTLEPFPAEVTLTSTMIDGRQIRQASIRDITEREKLREQFLQAQKMESVGRLAGGVAHDFNNMLSAILGYTDMALAKVDPADMVHGDLLEIQKAAERSADLTKQLLAFARKQTVTPRVVDLNETVDGLLKMLRRLIGEHVSLVWHPETHLWPVRVDPTQINQILTNLCVNARDAIADSGTVTIETGLVTFDAAYCLEHPGFSPGEFVLLSVCDTGSGMDKDVVAHIFEPFFTTKGPGTGTGLGLAMVYGVVKQNNGFINVYSEPGQGSVFRIYLPRHLGAAEASSLPGLEAVSSQQHETVLLVEDEPTMLAVARSALIRLGYEVLPTASPAEALRLVESYPDPIQVLLTDVIMPGMNGRDLATRLLERRPDLACVFMSGYTADVIGAQGVLDGGVAFIQKPFTVQELGLTIQNALAGE